MSKALGREGIPVLEELAGRQGSWTPRGGLGMDGAGAALATQAGSCSRAKALGL